MRSSSLKAIQLILLLTISSISFAQKKGKVDTTTTKTPPVTAVKPPVNTNPKDYDEVITKKAVTEKGMFWSHKVGDKYFLEIPEKYLGKDFLNVTRLSKAAADMRVGGMFGYAGDVISQRVIRFEMGPSDKVYLKTVSFEEYAKDSTSDMFTSVSNSNIQPIMAAFDVSAYNKKDKNVVFDITSFISGDNDIVGFSSATKTSLRLTPIMADKSYPLAVKAFPINVEIKTIKTFGRTPAPPSPFARGGGPSTNVTVEINSSIVMLPEVPMQSRIYDERVGYFTVGYTDFDLNPQGVEDVKMIKRWRLEPKDGDMDAYKKGELVEPKKQIVFYIDPATPKKWVPFLIQGVNDWQVAFEKAGFKNAVIAKMAPTFAEDSTWSLDDARNSAIVYKPSSTPNASGPSISDPRTGEIMESHINWYHNVMSLLRNWYMIQASPSDAGARKMVFDDALMGQLIRFVSSHEVGHTLGLRHNYGSSSTVPVESLRNKAFVEANGHTPSIMDYARFNYVAQPEDNISQSGLFPRIGDYDKWAIEWGYRLFPQFTNEQTERTFLNKWVSEKLKNKRLWFGTESNPDDPRSQNEDLGDDAMKASAYGIKNLQRIVPNLMTYTQEANTDYTNLSNMYKEVTGQFRRYMGHVSKNIAGVYETPKTVEQSGAVYEVVSKAKQKEAVSFLTKQLFETPTWLINKDIIAKTGENPIAVIGGIQDATLGSILRLNNFNKMAMAEAMNGSSAYNALELLGDLKRGIFSELTSGLPIDVYRRNLQKSFVNQLTSMLNPPKDNPASGAMVAALEKSDVQSVVRGFLQQLKTEVSAQSLKSTDLMTKYHLRDLNVRLEKALSAKD